MVNQQEVSSKVGIRAETIALGPLRKKLRRVPKDCYKPFADGIKDAGAGEIVMRIPFLNLERLVLTRGKYASCQF